MPPSNPANVTDWITAVAGIFAAVGTVGAVIVALWQIRAQARRQLDVSCSLAIMVPDADPVDVLALRATNIGFRAIKLTQAYLLTDDNRHVLSPFVRPNAFQNVGVQGVGRLGRGEERGDRLVVEVGGDRGGQVFVDAPVL